MLSLQNLFILYYYSDDVKMKKIHKYLELELEMKEKKNMLRPSIYRDMLLPGCGQVLDQKTFTNSPSLQCCFSFFFHHHSFYFSVFSLKEMNRNMVLCILKGK